MKSSFRERLKLVIADRLCKSGFLLVRYDSDHRRRWTDEVTRVKKERPFLLRHAEACNLITALNATAKVPGDLAEVGVAFGGSAKIICTYALNRTLHLFDTFEGLPEPTARDSPKYKTGQYNCSLESVREYLAAFKVEFHKGVFPVTAEVVKDRMFSFVHLDLDLYEGTLASLEFFYPRLSPGGVLISHDYLLANGVGAAFREFFANRRESVLELIGDQCMVVKLGKEDSAEDSGPICNRALATSVNQDAPAYEGASTLPASVRPYGGIK